MKIRKSSFPLILFASAALAGSAFGATSYDMTFTDTTANPTFSNATGTFTINGSDQITSFSVSFNALRSYTFEFAHGSPGDVISFDTASLGGTTVTYNPATGYFGSGSNYSFFLTEQQAGDPANGAALGIDGGQGLFGQAYFIDALSQGTFSSGPIDGGTWAVAAAAAPPVNAVPEPASAGIFLFGITCVGVFIQGRGRFVQRIRARFVAG